MPWIVVRPLSPVYPVLTWPALPTPVLKDSSVCSLITTPELTLRAKDIASFDFLPMHLYLLAGVIYFAMAWPLSLISRQLEAYLGRGRRQ